MKQFCKRAILALGLVTLIALTLCTSAEAGRRHHYRVSAYRVHAAHHLYRKVYPVHRAPVIVVPAVPTVRYYGHPYGPRVYVHAYVW